MLTSTQKRAALAIVNIFETSSVLGDYGKVTVLPADKGHLSYGRSQTTLRAGGGPGRLGELLRSYVQTPGARFAALLSPWLARVEAGDIGLDHERRLHNLLRACADDKAMRDVQDAFFDRAYWQPAEHEAGRLGLALPLSLAVVYDGFVHGSWALIRDRANAILGAPTAATEKRWIAVYVAQRRSWLAANDNPSLRPTVYRMDAFQRLIELDQWLLELPLLVRDAEISEASLAAMPPSCYADPQPGTRSLSVQTPLLRGLDVRLLQLGLSQRDLDVVADGVYGPGSRGAVQALQQAQSIDTTGVADAALVARLANEPFASLASLAATPAMPAAAPAFDSATAGALSPHFSLEELTASETALRQGIANQPGAELLPNLHALAQGLEQVRQALGNLPVVITSGFRSPALNEAVHGAQESLHLRGLAADLVCPRFGTPLQVCRAIVEAQIPFDELIHEMGRWTHIGFAAPGVKPRGKLLTLRSSGSRYEEGLHPVP